MNIEQLHNLFLKCNSISTDTRKIEKNDLFFALKGENFNANKFAKDALRKGAKYVVIDDENYSTSQTILVKNSLKALQELATYHRHYLGIPIIALTGSNGKTTTKELINSTLSKKYNTTATKGNLNNHIGVPLTLLSMTDETEIGIVEMGANHLKEIAFLCAIANPDYGYITNFGKSHLEGFGGVEGVIKGKSELYDYIKKNNKTAFINNSDNIQVEKTKQIDSFSFGENNSNSNLEISLIEAQPFVKCEYNKLKITSNLIGSYNFSNISAAICIANYFKVEDTLIKNAIKNYTPRNNRSQLITKGTNKIILDAYNANPTSMEAALTNFEKQEGKFKIAILGDMFELGKDAKKEHQSITDFALKLNIDKLILVGENFSLVKSNSSKLVKYNSFEDLKANYNFEIQHTAILIKGSRGMALERVLDWL